MTQYQIKAEPSVDADVEAVFDWYEGEQEGLGLEFVDELRAVYLRIVDGPLKYVELRSGIRRALTGRFPQSRKRLSWFSPCFMPPEIPLNGSDAWSEAVKSR